MYICIHIHIYNYIYMILFIFRERGRDKERKGNTDIRGKHPSVASPMCPNQGPNLHPRHVP